MASTSSFDQDLSCPVCRDIFNDPVVLACSHSFCKGCLLEWWTHKRTRECPVCKKVNKEKYPPCNLSLKNLCETFIQERHQRASKHQRTSSESKDHCNLHAEKHKFFCLGCQQPACVVCRDSKKHNNHSFRPIDEAALDHKEEVQKSLKPLQEKLEAFNTFKTKCEQRVKYIEGQVRSTERKIKEQFKKLHQFLHEEEEARITALREEEQQKSQMMMEKIDGLNRERSTLSNTIRAIEEDLKAEDISFLQNYKTTVERAQLTLQDPQLVSESVIDVAKHLGNLTFRVWDKMKDIVSYTPVILNPNSSDTRFIVSDDLTSVSRDEELQFASNLVSGSFILGYEGFNSETHSWDVEVGDSRQWNVGVETPAQVSTGKVFRGIGLHQGQYRALCPATDLVLEELKERKPQRIRVLLDWNKGKLSFFDPDANTHIHTFTHTFIGTPTLFPCFHTTTKLPLKILPRKFSVTHMLWCSPQDVHPAN